LTTFFVHCRYTLKLWGLVKKWLGLHFCNLADQLTQSVYSCWSIATKRKRRSFYHPHHILENLKFRTSMPHHFVLLGKIINETNLWMLAGAKRLSNLYREVSSLVL
jgi:hypothetical protein